MNIVNPPAFDHILDNAGDSVKLYITSLGSVTWSPGQLLKQFNLPADFPVAANVVSIEVVHDADEVGFKALSSVLGSSGAKIYFSQWTVSNGSPSVFSWRLFDSNGGTLAVVTFSLGTCLLKIFYK